MTEHFVAQTVCSDRLLVRGSRGGASLTMLVGYRAEVVRPAYPTVVGGPVFTERTSVGLDVHARSVAAAAIDGVTGELFQQKLLPGTDRILERVRQLPGLGLSG